MPTRRLPRVVLLARCVGDLDRGRDGAIGVVVSGSGAPNTPSSPSPTYLSG